MNITGFLKIDSIDKNGSIVDTWEDKNTIMDTGRADVMNLLNGLTKWSKPIGRFVLGEYGYNGGAAPAAFTSDRTQTFTEATGNGYAHIIDFDIPVQPAPTAPQALPYNNTDTATVTAETNTSPTLSQVTVESNIGAGTFEITYRIQIPQGAGNDGGVKQYSEAALYTLPDDSTGTERRIFSMRTFPTRAKDSTISYDIFWTISFG